MKRSRMPRGSPPERRTRLARHTPMPTGLKRPPMDPTFRQSVLSLSDGVCAFCGLLVREDAWAAHHRLLRVHGGKDTHANVIPLHHPCHNLVHVVHGPQWSYRHGFLVPRWHGDPDTWPAYRWLTSWRQPTSNGWVPAAPHIHQTELGETA